MPEKSTNILVKFLLQFAIVIGVGMSAFGQPSDQIRSGNGIFSIENSEVELTTLRFLAVDKSQSPLQNSPAEEPSSQEENGEEENEENKDTEYDGELSHYQIGSLLDPFISTVSFIDNSICYGNYNVPLYILFHCWKSFIS